MLLAVQPAVSDTAQIKIYDWQGNHIDTVNTGACTCSCPGGTGANAQRYCECTVDYTKRTSPGLLTAKATFNYGTAECDGKSSGGGTSGSSSFNLYTVGDIARAEIFHSSINSGNTVIDTIGNKECDCSCACTSQDCQYTCECSYDYPKASNCKIDGVYKAKTYVTHGHTECDGKTSGGGTSTISKHDLYTCDIEDTATVYVYKPGVTSPSTSSSNYVWKKDIICPVSCSSGTYISDCPSTSVDQATLCNSEAGYYTVNVHVDHKGNSCVTGGALHIKDSWVDNTNFKSFSCSLHASAKIWYYVGGTYFVNAQAMDCPQPISTTPGTNDAGLHSCTYAGYTPPAGEFVTVSSQKRYCRIEGDYYTKVEFTYSGKNWDGSNLHGGSHLKETVTEKKFNVNWDGESGVYCKAPTCFSDKTTGNHDFGVAWNIGGEKAASSCCGDDSGEWYRKCETDESKNPKSCDGDNSACCSHQTDCVAHNKCFAHGWVGDSDSDNDQEKCVSGVWEDIGDKVTYYVYHPNGATAHTSAEKACAISCDGGTYMSNCEAYAIDEAALCNQRGGFYTVRAKVTHRGSSCVTDGNALHHTTSWTDDSKKKVFSCGLDTTMQVWYWVGGHYYVNGVYLDCPADQFSHDPTDNSEVTACTYSGWTPNPDHTVTVSGNKHQCNREGDHKIKVRVHYAGKNWDGTALEDASQDLDITPYNINWDGHSGIYCKAPTCFPDKTTGAHDFGVAWNIGGETAATTCCGDDNNEWYRKCETDELVKNACKGDNNACCSARYDCVAYGNCYNDNYVGDIDGDNAEEKCVDGVWQDLPEKAKYRIFHYTVGQIASYDVICSTSCPSGTGNEAQTYHECTMDYNECKIPGWYQAEVDILHNRPECQNMPTSNVKSALSKTNLYFCDIDDEVYYYVYHPDGSVAHTSPKKKCDTSCDGGTYMSDCETYSVPEKAICSQRGGFYTVRAKVSHKGNSCVNGNTLPNTESWVEDSKMQVFSCALDTTAKIKIYVGGTTLLNWKDMSCTDITDQFSHDPTHKSFVVPCSYTWDPSPYITHSSMNKRCDYEGDVHFVSRMAYSGKNWDGTALEATTQDIDEVKYNVNWDGHSGIFCSLTCFADKTTGAHDSGIAWNIGGETAASSCCGDDGSEWYRTCETSDDEKSATTNACSWDNKACCKARYDCVTRGNCFDNGYDLDADSDGYNEWCVDGVWKLRRDDVRYRIYSPSNKVVFDKTSSCLTSCSGEQRVETCESPQFTDACTEDGWYRAQIDFTYNGKNCNQKSFHTTTETFKNNKIFKCFASKPPVQVRHRMYHGGGSEEANSGILDCPGKGANEFCQEDASGNRIMKITANSCPTWDYDVCKTAGQYTVKSEFIFNGKTCDDLPLVTPEWHGPINAYWCAPGYYKIRHTDSGTDLTGGWKVLNCPKSTCKGTDNKEMASESCKMDWTDLKRDNCKREGKYEAKSKFFFNGECDGKGSKTSVEEFAWTAIYKVNFDNIGSVNKAPPGDPGTYDTATADPDRYCTTTCFDDTTTGARDSGVAWNLGGGTKTKYNDGSWYALAQNNDGSASASTCCGDDANEWARKCETLEELVTGGSKSVCDVSTDDLACCPAATDCVFNDKCYVRERLVDIDSDGDKEFCRDGQWVNIASVKPYVYLWDQDKQVLKGDDAGEPSVMSCGDLTCSNAYANKKSTCWYDKGMDTLTCDFYSQASGDWCYAQCTKKYTTCTVSGWYYGYVKFDYRVPGVANYVTYCCDNDANGVAASKVANCPNSCDDEKTGDRKGCRSGTCQSHYYCGYDMDGTYGFKKPDGTEYRNNVAMTCVNDGNGPTTWRIDTTQYGKETCSYTFTYPLNDGSTDNKISVTTVTTTATNHDPITRTTDPLEMCTLEGSYQYKMLWQYYGENRAMGGTSYSGKSNTNRYFDDTPTSNDPTGLPNSNEKAYSQMYYVDFDNLNDKNRDVAGQSSGDDASIAWRYCDTRCFSDTTTGSQNKDQGVWWDVKYGTSVNNGGSDSKDTCCGDDASEWSLRSEGTGGGSLHRVPGDNIGVRSWQASDAPHFSSGKTYNYYLSCCPRETDCVSNGTCYDSAETGGNKGGDVSANACHCLSWRARSYDVDKYNKHAWFEPNDHPDLGDGGLHDEAGANAEAPCCGDDGDNDNFYYYSDSRDYCHYCEKGVNKTSQVDNKLYNGVDSANYNDFFGVDSQEFRDCDGAGDTEIVGHSYNEIYGKQNYQITCYFWSEKDPETGADWSKAVDCDSNGCHQAPVEPQEASHRQRCTWLELDKANSADNTRFRLNNELKDEKPISIDVATEGWCLDNATHTCYYAFDKDEKKYWDICKDDGDDAYDGFDWSDDVFKGNCPYPGTVNVTTLNCYYHEKALFNETEGQIDLIDGGYYTCAKTGCQMLSSTLGYERELCHPRDGPIPAISVKDIKVRKQTLPGGKKDVKIAFHVITSSYLQQHGGAPERCDMCQATLSYKNIEKTCTHQGSGVFLCDVSGLVTNEPRPVMTITATLPMCHFCTQEAAPDQCEYEGTPAPETGICMLYTDAHYQTVFSFEKFVKLEVRKMSGKADIVENTMSTFVGETFLLGAHVTNYWTQPMNLVLKLHKEEMWSTFDEEAFTLFPGESKTIPVEINPYKLTAAGLIEIYVVDADSLERLNEKQFYVRVVYASGSAFMATAPGVGAVDIALLLALAGLFLARRTRRRTVAVDGREG